MSFFLQYLSILFVRLIFYLYFCHIKKLLFALKTFIMRRLVIFCIAIITYLCASAQQEGFRCEYSGQVRDGRNGKPLPHVNILVPGTNIATVTNADGEYVIKTPSRPAHLSVSHVGYKALRVPIGSDRVEGMKIRLTPNTIVLDDVIVMVNDPKEILFTAIDKIPDNYSNEAERFRCFYRETAQKRQKFIYLSEAVADMYKTTYKRGIEADRVAVVKGRRLLSASKKDTLSVKVIGGPTQSVVMDVVKNRDFILDKEELELYEIQMESPTYIDDRAHFVISIAPHYNVDYAQFYGKFYIDKQNLSFTRIELSLDTRDREKATRYMLVKKPAGVKFRPKEMTLLINYRLDNGITRISYVRSTFRFNCDWKRRFFATSFTAINEMVVTDRVDGPAQPIARKDAFDNRESLYDMTKNFDEPDFWKDYNIIEPTESLEHGIGKLLKNRTQGNPK